MRCRKEKGGDSIEMDKLAIIKMVDFHFGWKIIWLIGHCNYGILPQRIWLFKKKNQFRIETLCSHTKWWTYTHTVGVCIIFAWKWIHGQWASHSNCTQRVRPFRLLNAKNQWAARFSFIKFKFDRIHVTFTYSIGLNAPNIARFFRLQRIEIDWHAVRSVLAHLHYDKISLDFVISIERRIKKNCHRSQLF